MKSHLRGIKHAARGLAVGLFRNLPAPLVRGSFRPRTFEDQVYVSIIVEGDICFDVGSNVGGMSLLFSMLAGSRGLATM